MSEEENKQNTPEQSESYEHQPEAAEAEQKGFDWDSLFQDELEYSEEEKREMEKMYEDTITDVEERQLVTGTVVDVTDKDVVLNIGFKSDGLIPLSEFKDEEPKPGNEFEVLVEKKEDEEGQIILSRKKAIAERAWQTIVDAYDNDKILQGHVTGRTKGGMIVDVMGLDAFMPGSQIDVKPIKDYDAFVGQTMDVKVVKLNKEYRNIVVSHKAIIESDLEQQKSEILSKLEKGQVLEGVVKNLISFGVFVDLGGVDGLIHITDVSWGRINHPEEVLELGQKINVVVLDYDEEKKRISLGLKQLSEHPWETLDENIQEGSVVEGKVVNIEDYGAFIEIKPGVEGLVHVSEMSWSQNLKTPQEYVNMGDTVEAKVLNIDRENRKLSLGLKQLTPDPWENIEEKYPVNTQHQAKVQSITNFGLFLELEEGVEGLLHISDISWTKKYNHPKEFADVGDMIDVMVLEIDKENRRLSLGHKQLQEDPWDTFESIFLPDSYHEATVKSHEDKGAVAELPYGVEAYIPPRHLTKQDNNKPEEGETLSVKILEFDKDNRRIVASHTDVWKEEERKQQAEQKQQEQEEEKKTQEDLSKVKSKVDKSTMADELEGLEQIKSQIQESEKEKQKEAMERMEQKSKDEDEEESDSQNKSDEDQEDKGSSEEEGDENKDKS